MVEIDPNDTLGLLNSVCYALKNGLVAVISTLQENDDIQSIGLYI